MTHLKSDNQIEILSNALKHGYDIKLTAGEVVNYQLKRATFYSMPVVLKKAMVFTKDTTLTVTDPANNTITGNAINVLQKLQAPAFGIHAFEALNTGKVSQVQAYTGVSRQHISSMRAKYRDFATFWRSNATAKMLNDLNRYYDAINQQ